MKIHDIELHHIQCALFNSVNRDRNVDETKATQNKKNEANERMLSSEDGHEEEQIEKERERETMSTTQEKKRNNSVKRRRRKKGLFHEKLFLKCKFL